MMRPLRVRLLCPIAFVAVACNSDEKPLPGVETITETGAEWGGDGDGDGDGDPCPDAMEGDPAEIGEWTVPMYWPVLAVHAIQLPTDQILMFAGADRIKGGGSVATWRPPVSRLPADPTGENWDNARDFFLWNMPAPCAAEMSAGDSLNCDIGDGRITNWTEVGDDGVGASFTYVPYDINFFCAGHSTFADGTALVAGGHIANGQGLPDSGIFDPYQASGADPYADFHGGMGYWSQTGDMARSRWYPSHLTMPDGSVLTFSGEDRTDPEDPQQEYVTTVERYDPDNGTWTTVADFDGEFNVPFYPFMYLVHDDQNGEGTPYVFYAGAEVAVQLGEFNENQYKGKAYDPDDFDWNHDPEAAPQPTAEPASQLGGGTSVMLLDRAIMKTSAGHEAVNNNPSAAYTEILPEGLPASFGALAASKDIVGRFHVTAVTLPTGQVLAVGGNTSGHDDDSAVDETELYDWFDGNRWCKMAERKEDPVESKIVPRLYHSNAWLLRDGRVALTASGNGAETQAEWNNVEVFSPPYLFQGPRPSVGPDPLDPVVPAAIGNSGGTFRIDVPNADEVGVAYVNLMRTASITHNFSMDNRFIHLEFSTPDPKDPDGRICVTEPADGYDAPPGIYMLFVISDAGIPSVGGYVTVGDGLGSPDDDCDGGFEFAAANGTTFDGLLVTCSDPETSRLDPATFGRELDELCKALPACVDKAQDGSISAELIETDGVPESPPIDMGSGAISVDAAGQVDASYQTTNEYLGEGEHVVRFCVEDGADPERVGCLDQSIRVDAPLAEGQVVGGNSTGEIAGEIAPGFLPLVAESTATALILGDDDAEVVDLPLGFEFPFYGGGQADQLTVHSNGGVTFGSASALSYNNQQLPHSTAPDIAVWWDDLNPTAGGDVLTYYDGQRFIVSWEDVPHYGSGTDGVSFQVHLYPSGRVELHYADAYFGSSYGSWNFAASATVGTQKPNDSAYLLYSHNTASLPTQAGSPFSLAVSDDECIASDLRYPDWVACTTPTLDLPAQFSVDACEHVDGNVWVPVPNLPDLCAFKSTYAVQGWVVEAGDSPNDLQPLNPPVEVLDHRVAADAGVYTIDWYIMDGQTEVSGPFTQTMVVAPDYAVRYDSYESTGYDWVDLSSSGTATNVSDDGEVSVTLPFGFPFYGTEYSQILVGGNGAIRFNSGDVHYSNASLPSSASTSPDIAPFWDDLNPTAAGDAYYYYDQSNLRFVISWEGVPHYSNIGEADFQIHLYETGRIEFHYQDADFGNSSYDNGKSATVGLQDHVAGMTSTHYKQISYNTAWAGGMASQARAFEPVCDFPAI